MAKIEKKDLKQSLPESELAVIRALEESIGKPLPVVEKVIWTEEGKEVWKHQLGIVIEAGTVTQLGLCRNFYNSKKREMVVFYKTLETLPESIGNLKALTIIDLVFCEDGGLVGDFRFC